MPSDHDLVRLQDGWKQHADSADLSPDGFHASASTSTDGVGENISSCIGLRIR
ncbi:unnamed protein product [Penicillium camemberti]|uniref:Str. FM013 n=1 Tax=Penicillium camemberti (strain FM 013) TaxID=1429867 RepID=A0A0G4P4B2_PENC3|nr:unnamed protein product [Penicillium camemberti]